MRIWRRVLIIAVVVFVALVSCFFLLRGALLQMAFVRVQGRIHDQYKSSLTASSIQFSGLSQIVARDIILIPAGADTLVYVREADVNVSLLSVIRGKMAFDGLKINDVSLSIYNEPERNNLNMLRSAKGDSTASTDVSASSGYRERAASWEAKLFRVLGTAFEAKNVEIRYQDTARRESIYIPSFTYDLHELAGVVIDRLHADTLSFSGTVVKRKSEYQCRIQHMGSDSAYLPFLDQERGLKCRFKSITATVKFDNSSDECTISTDASLKDFHINHWRLANEDVVLPDANFKGTLKLTNDAVELDSAFTIALHMPEVASDTFFQSLPGGMFGTLKGISCTGSLAYDLNFAIHTNNPDSLLFNSALAQKGLRIELFGAENYGRINSSFSYDAYDKDRLVRTLMVGPENPFFTRLDQMSPFLPQAVLQAEDPFFMHHRGFLQESFRESIVKNYREHRFARGGSTISMQLVKNVFLSRDKTVSRKAEEALIVYLIENLGLVPKERMLEVYLNVIEWGPNVYGIGEASHFYFNKRPSQLTLQESLFLASVIPRPKGFQYQFDKQGQLRESMSCYFKILTERMVLRNVLDPNDTIGLRPEVALRGPALHMVVPSDTIIPENDVEVAE
jgi:hypothetical protein